MMMAVTKAQEAAFIDDNLYHFANGSIYYLNVTQLATKTRTQNIKWESFDITKVKLDVENKFFGSMVNPKIVDIGKKKIILIENYELDKPKK
jgi:hypothetical protein